MPQQRGSLVGRFQGVARRMGGHRRSALLATRGKPGTRTSVEKVSADWAFRRPITGIAGCYARALSGHAAAAPPSSVMNSRRLMAYLSGQA